MRSFSAHVLPWVALAIWVLTLSTNTGAQAVPTDPSGGCPIPPATVAGMFQTGTLNGVVKAADSTLGLTPNCGFFQWSEQMFLWMTSPAPATYGGGSRIMFSPRFFTVTPEGPDHRREFLVNRPGRPLQMLLRKTELGPHGLPAVISRSGHIVEVIPTPPNQPVPPVVKLQNGATATLGSVQRSANGTLRFFDQRGAEVQVQRLQLPAIVRPQVELAPDRPAPVVPLNALQTAIQARKLVINKIPIFLDLAGNIIDVEPGQADNGVLLSQNGSLIYYITVVNDLYAYHRTMQGAAAIPDNTNITFPLTTTDANLVKTFATSKGHTILEPQALAIESKSSWIEATAVPNPADYIQVSATVPTFNKSDPKNWVPDGQKTVNLVLIGLHVVGSTNGHGEMVWGTFEHLGNSPDATYSYTSTSGVKTVSQNTAGTWTFTPAGSAGPFNGNDQAHPSPHWTGSAIAGGSTGTPPVEVPVAPVPVLRSRPWGTSGANTSLNTQVIAANASVISQLKPGDVRRNYFQLGTTWTIAGAPPNPGNEVGTNQLANSTIETFVQANSPTAPGSNCFSCHFTNKVPVSHVYQALKPLP